MITYKLQSRPLFNERKVEETVFIGIDDHGLQYAGELILSVGEWQMFGALMKMGAERANMNYHRVEIITEGDDAVVEAFSEED